LALLAGIVKRCGVCVLGTAVFVVVVVVVMFSAVALFSMALSGAGFL